MSTQEHPNILCTKCATVVSWRPHCPHCHAYLEFAGVPPWHPDEPTEAVVEIESVELKAEPKSDLGIPDGPIPPDSPAIEHPEDFGDSGIAEQAHERAVLPVSTITMLPIEYDEADAIADAAVDVVPEPVEPGAFALLSRGLRRDPDRHVTGYLAALTLAIILILVFGLISGPASATIAAPFFIGWALVSVAIFGMIPDQREFEIAEAEEFRRLAEEEAERARLEREAERRMLAEVAILAAEPVVSAGTVMEDEAPIEARAPQTVNSTIERTAPMRIQVDDSIDQRCEGCGRMNPSNRRFCEQCGLVLGTAPVAPTVVAVSQTEAEKQAEEARKRKKIGVSSSWRTPIFALTIGAVVVGAFAFAFLGPGAFQIRFGMTRAFQVINQWIDPYSGRAVTIETVVASSTLPGTDAQQIATSDARTFWASAPSKDYGVGTVLTYTLGVESEIDRMVIFPGIQSAQFDSRALASPKDITLTFDDGTVTQATLESLDIKTNSRQLVQFPQNVTKQIVLRIDSVYPPRGANAMGVGEVAISGTEFLEVPQPPKVFGFQNGTRNAVIPGVGSGSNQ
jgi:hypothetical protein